MVCGGACMPRSEWCRRVVWQGHMYDRRGAAGEVGTPWKQGVRAQPDAKVSDGSPVDPLPAMEPGSASGLTH
jgi:hypothetical protein